MATERRKTYYFVPYGWGGQHGTDIQEVKLTDSELQIERLNGRGAYFRKYIAALYYTQD